MKCSLVVSKSWQARAASNSSDPQPVAKVVLSVDPLRSDDLEFTMEMAKDVVGPRSRLTVEGKVEHKFDMKPHNENFEGYGKCAVKGQVIDNDRGMHMRPLPGMVGLFAVNKDMKKAAAVKPSDLKRTRRDRGELVDIMFKLFERNRIEP
ncbi:hypothetical protein AKJ16_DCAP03617 [Drosera capensis]